MPPGRSVMNNSKYVLVLRHIAYILFLFVLYAVQTTPRLLVIGGVKPLLVIPVAISVAMLEGEFVGGVYGALAGLLCDVSVTSLFGFNGFFICLFCVISGLLIIYLMRCNLVSCLLFTFVTSIVRGSIEFLFSYGMWGHENVWKLYVLYTVPTVIYTLVITAPVFWLIRYVYQYSGAAVQK